jgi:hypothetical protein
MTPADIDPSLCDQPLLEGLDDGFSPPVHEDASSEERREEQPECVIGPKSAF